MPRPLAPWSKDYAERERVTWLLRSQKVGILLNRVTWLEVLLKCV